MNRVISLALVVVAIIHLLPVSGVLGAEQLATLYGISFEEPNIEILVRHRAVLFGLLGFFLLYAAFNSAVHLAALVVGIISVISFLYIARSVGGYNPEISWIFTADLVALVFLILGFVVYMLQKLKSG